jgi:RNA polymerase sigma-70 factor (ECF subfamily)
MGKGRRNTEEFVIVLRQCEGTLMRICRLFSNRQAADIEDLYQEIVYQLWLSWPSYRGKSAVGTWVTRVALNTAAGQWRSHKRHPRLATLDEEVCRDLAEEASDPRYELLYSLIERLDTRDRELVYLYLDCQRQADIAAILGISEAAVKKRIQRIKQRLKQYYEEEQ